MTDTRAFRIAGDAVGVRLDTALSELVPDISRSWAHELVSSGRVRINGQTPKPSRRLSDGDLVEVEIVLAPGMTAEPEDIPLTIVYCDEDLAIVDKPAGLVVHPAAGHPAGTLANALAARFPASREVGIARRPGIVHRLDKDTSGLMVVALTVSSYESLQKQISSRAAQRSYLALASGHPKPQEGAVEAPVGRDPRNRLRMAAGGIASRWARTSYRTLEQFASFSLLEARLHTGRTHQIRVHLSAIGHPLAGDRVYGGPAVPGLHRQFLHAHKLSLRSPRTGEKLEFFASLPPDLESVLDALRG